MPRATVRAWVTGQHVEVQREQRRLDHPRGQPGARQLDAELRLQIGVGADEGAAEALVGDPAAMRLQPWVRGRELWCVDRVGVREQRGC